jgi:hypothetical protein
VLIYSLLNLTGFENDEGESIQFRQALVMSGKTDTATFQALEAEYGNLRGLVCNVTRNQKSDPRIGYWQVVGRYTEEQLQEFGRQAGPYSPQDFEYTLDEMRGLIPSTGPRQLPMGAPKPMLVAGKAGTPRPMPPRGRASGNPPQAPQWGAARPDPRNPGLTRQTIGTTPTGTSAGHTGRGFVPTCENDEDVPF